MNTLITYHLERNGFRTMSALDGEIGLLLAMRNRFDIVILDLMLPSMSGIEVCRQIQTRCTPPPAIIILTAVSKDIIQALREKLSVVEILHKPFKPCELVQLTRTTVQESRNRTASKPESKADEIR